MESHGTEATHQVRKESGGEQEEEQAAPGKPLPNAGKSGDQIEWKGHQEGSDDDLRERERLERSSC